MGQEDHNNYKQNSQIPYINKQKDTLSTSLLHTHSEAIVSDNEQPIQINRNNSENNDNNSIIQKKYTKYIFLVFSALLTTGVFYQGPILSVLRKEIKMQFGISDGQYSTLYEVPSFCNLLFPFLTGVLNDKFGTTKMLFFYTLQTVVAMFAFLLGQSIKSFAYIMVYGIVGYLSQEAIVIAQNTITSQWFQGGNITFALGILIVNIRVTEIMATSTLPSLYDINDNLVDPIWAAIGFCMVSIAATFIVYFMHRKRENYMARNNIKSNFKIRSKKIKLSDIKYLKPNYWMVTSLCSLGYASFYLFIQKFEEICYDKFRLDKVQAGNLQSMIYFISMAGPLNGLLVDRIGKKVILLGVSFFIQCIAYILWLVMPDCKETCYGNALIPGILQGIFLMIFSSIIWSCFPATVQPRFLGSAFGINSSIKAIMFTVFPYLLSWISTKYGVIQICIPLLILSILAFFVCLGLFFVDKKYGNLLHELTRNSKKKNYLIRQQEKDILLENRKDSQNSEQNSNNNNDGVQY